MATCYADDQPVVDAASTLLQQYAFVDSLSIIQDNHVVFEYFDSTAGLHRSHEIRSLGKSIISLALGSALGDARISLVDRPVFTVFDSWLPPAHGDQAKMTFADVFTMRSGIACKQLGSTDNPCDPRQMKSSLPWREYILAPMRDSPGSRFAYNDAAPQVAIALIYAVTKVNAWSFIKQDLFEPLSLSATASLGRLTPNDMRKIGQLVLQQGCWKHQQLVPAAWIRRATAPHVLFSESDHTLGYGYFWWWRKLSLHNREISISYAAGNGGQLILIAPSLNAIVISTGNAFDKDISGFLSAIFRDLLPSVAEPAGLSATDVCAVEQATESMPQ